MNSMRIAECGKRDRARGANLPIPSYPLSLEKGNATIIVLVLIAMASIMVPVLTRLVREQARSTIRSQRSSAAFQLAEAAVKRGYWKLVETTSNWDTIVDGGSITGYTGTTDYSDLAGGTYRINLTGDASLNRVTLTGTGKSTIGNEFRAIEVVYTRASIQGSIQAPSVDVGGSASIFWGMILSTGDIELQGSCNELYPRKRARGEISATGAPYADRDIDGTASTDNYEWWSYNYAPGVPDIPTPDLATYSAQASALGLSYNTYQNWAGYTNTLESNVYYFGAGAKFTGTKHFRGKMFVIGNLDFSGTAGTAGNYSTTPPTTAWEEYQKNCPSRDGATDDGNYTDGIQAYGDTVATNEYPGDAGYHTVGTFNFAAGGGGASAGAVAFKGFIYVTGNANCSGNVRLHGAMMVASGGAVGSGGWELFYDNTISVVFTNSTPSMASWREVLPTQF